MVESGYNKFSNTLSPNSARGSSLSEHSGDKNQQADVMDDKKPILKWRSKSVTKAEEITKGAETFRKLQPDRPCHKPKDSLFTWSSKFRDFTGLVNWAFLLLLMGGIRLLLENLLKYGIMIDPIQWLVIINGGSPEFNLENPSIVLLFYINVHILFTLWVEKKLIQKEITNRQALFLHIFNFGIVLMIPVICNAFWGNRFGLVGAVIMCAVYVITFLKLWSYVQVNYWCRLHKELSAKAFRRRASSVLIPDLVHSDRSSKVPDNYVSYPDNLTLPDLYYFMLVPSLCYELNFPRTARIRKTFLIKRILEVVIGLQVIFGLFQQWIIPSVKNSLETFSKMEVLAASERLLKLAVPNHLLWLIFFYLMFHSYLNIMGEILRFADRNFYGDWWNATNLEDFWRQWNLPIHRWAVRHLYIPMIKHRSGRVMALGSVFLLSALFHEYLVSVPLRMVKWWSFYGMMLQVPLVPISKFVEKKFGPRFSNTIVWLSLILGQPLCIMMYYHDYVITHFGKDLIEQFGKM